MKRTLSAIVCLWAGALAQAGDGRKPVYVPSPVATIGIATEGSYYLTENLDFSGSGIPAINIAVDNVNLDLRGHTVTCDTSVDCILVSTGAFDGIRITNGVIRGGLRAIYYSWSGTAVHSISVDRMDIGGMNPTGGVGISLHASSGTVVASITDNVINCDSATANGMELYGVGNSVVKGNVASNCGSGIYVSSASFNVSVTDNQLSGNEYGVDTFSDNGDITHNLASGNRLSAIYVGGDNNLVAFNVASFTYQGYGIRVVGHHNNVRENSAIDNDYDGISVQSGSTLNTIEKNVATGNFDCGIRVAGDNCLVVENRTQDNPNGGFCGAATQTLACGVAGAGNANGITNLGSGNLLCGNLP